MNKSRLLLIDDEADVRYSFQRIFDSPEIELVTAASGEDRAVPGTYFSDKKLAKAKRQELNGDEGNGRNLRYIVSPGPDHHNYKGVSYG